MKDKLDRLLDNCYDVIGGMKSSCIVIMNDGAEFSGVSVKNATFRDAIYAEQAAITRAVANGYKKGDFEKLYLYADAISLEHFKYLQREVITEFFEDDKEVVIMNHFGEEKVFKVGKLYKEFE